jgi:hypothetical protein
MRIRTQFEQQSTGRRLLTRHEILNFLRFTLQRNLSKSLVKVAEMRQEINGALMNNTPISLTRQI